MPTYINNTSASVQAEGTNYVNPGDTYSTIKMLSNTDLTLLSETPYYNPLLGAETITVEASGAAQSYSVSLDSKVIRLTPISGTPRVYINNQNNTPALTVTESISLENSGKINLIYVDNAGSVSCTLDIKETS